MAQLNLEEEEIKALIQLLDSTLSDLSVEIADTDREEYREQIKTRRDLLENVVIKLNQAG